jgi:phage-related tail protein
MPNQKTIRVDELTRSLRAWITEQQARHYDTAEIGSAMAYELAALIADAAKTIEDAHRLLGQTTTAMRDQFRTFGVGAQRRHP